VAKKSEQSATKWALLRVKKENGVEDQLKETTFILGILHYRFLALIAQLLEHIDLGLKGTSCVQHSLNGIFY
jgi:hypothetical protein